MTGDIPVWIVPVLGFLGFLVGLAYIVTSETRRQERERRSLKRSRHYEPMEDVQLMELRPFERLLFNLTTPVGWGLIALAAVAIVAIWLRYGGIV